MQFLSVDLIPFIHLSYFKFGTVHQFLSSGRVQEQTYSLLSSHSSQEFFEAFRQIQHLMQLIYETISNNITS